MRHTNALVTYEARTLASGLRVLLGRVPRASSVAIGVWAQVGGRYESARVSGMSHFVEHMVFKGTRRRSCEQLKQAIEGTGGMLNAFTGEEYTCYVAKVLAPHAPRALDVLTDMLLNPRMTSVDVEKERSVILEEIHMHRDQPGQHVHDVINELLWPDHPLGRSLAGTPDSMAGITRQQLRQYLRAYYTPRNLLVAVVGDLSMARVIDVLRAHVRGRSGRRARAPLPAPRVNRTDRLTWELRETEQTHVCLGAHAVSRRHAMRLGVNLLHVLLGANMSSRLFREVREKRALAYDVSSYVKYFSDTGAFVVTLGCEPPKLVEAVTIIARELQRAARDLIPQAELKRAKDFYRGQLLMSLEDHMDHMMWLGEPFLMEGRLHSLPRTMRALEQVTARDLRQAARRLFRPERFRLAVVGRRDPDGKRQLQQLLKM